MKACLRALLLGSALWFSGASGSESAGELQPATATPQISQSQHVPFLSDTDSVYMYLETLQELAYANHPNVHRWSDSPEDRARLCKVTAEVLSDNSTGSGDKISCADLIAQMNASLPTRYEDPNSSYLLKMAAKEVTDELATSKIAFQSPRLGTLPLGTLNARSLRPLGGTEPLVVVNQSLFPFVHEFSKIALATIPIEAKDGQVAIELDGKFFESDVRRNNDFLVRFSKALEDFANDRFVRGQAPPRPLDAPLIIVLDSGIEDFVIAHEFAHLILHHQTDDRYQPESNAPLTRESLMRSWGEEAMADMYAATLVNKITVRQQQDPNIGELRGELEEFARYAPVLFFIYDRLSEEAHYIHKYGRRSPEPSQQQKGIILQFLEASLAQQMAQAGGSPQGATSEVAQYAPPEVQALGDHPPAWAREMLVQSTWTATQPTKRDPVVQSFADMAVLLGRHVEVLWSEVAPLWVKIVNEDAAAKPEATPEVPAVTNAAPPDPAFEAAVKASDELESGDYLNAIKDANKAIDGGEVGARFTRGRANLGLHRFRAAVDDFSAMIARSDSYYWNRANRAIAYDGLGDVSDARKDYDEALKQGGAQDGKLLAYHGDFLLEVGENDAGIASLRRAVTFEPDNAELWTDLAEGLIYAGQYSTVVETVEKIQAIKPSKQNDEKYTNMGLMFGAIAEACLGRDARGARQQFEATLKPERLEWSFDLLDHWAKSEAHCPKSAKALAKDMIGKRKKLVLH
jgi:tetratricopeptide (TPR) repeat protein